MRVAAVHLYLPSNDLKGSIDFYAGGLQFTALFELPEYCTLALDSFHLTFVPTGRENVPLSVPGAGFLFSVEVDDIRDYHSRIRGRVRFQQELELMMPGVWQFSVIDNNGYHVGFSQPNRRA